MKGFINSQKSSITAKHAEVIKLHSHDVLLLKIDPNDEFLSAAEFLITPSLIVSLSRQQCSS
jgi:hypothetical protein